MSISSAQTHSLARDTAVRELLRPLDRFLKLEGVTELVVNRPGEVLYERGPEWVVEPVPDLSYARLWSLVKAIATCSDQEVGPKSPLLSAVLPDGQRIQVIVPPAVEPGQVSLSIRLPAQTLRSLSDYRSDGAFDRYHWTGSARQEAQSGAYGPADRVLIDALLARDLAAFLTEAVRGRRNIAVVGDTGSGKTTLMKSLCQHIPVTDRIVTIEDVRELELPAHGNRVHLVYSRGGQGVARVTPAELIAACLRMRPDRVLLAELRGSEAFDFLKLLTTGHSGSITSFHAESCALALERYVLMAKEHPDASIFDADGLKRLVSLTLEILVHVRAEICETAEGLRVKRRFVSEVHFDPFVRASGRVSGQCVSAGLA